MDALAARLDAWLTPRRIATVAAVVAILSGLAVVLNVVLGHPPRTLIGTTVLPDYLAHWTGGRLLLDGDTARLYDPDVQHAVQGPVSGGAPDVSWFVSPPVTALLFAPLAALPYLASGALWTLVSVGLVVAAMVVLRPLYPRLRSRHWGVVTLVVAASQPLLELVGAGQDSALTLLVWASTTRLLGAGRPRTAGAVLALGIVKPQLFLLGALVLLLQRRWSALVAWLATTALLVAVSAAVTGPGTWTAWAEVPFSSLYQRAVQSAQAFKMVGVPSFLVSLAPTGWSGAAQAVGLAVSLGLVVAFSLAVLRGPRDAVAPVWALAALTTVVASPHLLSYDLLLALPALLHLVETRGSRGLRLMLVALVLLTWTAHVRHAVSQSWVWPLTWVGATWTTVALLALWWTSYRDVRELSPRSDQEPEYIDSSTSA